MNITKNLIVFISALLACSACAIHTVRQSDLDAWIGQPVIKLEKHPVFITIPVVKTTASDGTEIWNYVNGVNIGKCTNAGNIFGRVDFNTYTQFTNCVQQFAACNNIFYINNGKVTKYMPVGSGGVSCFTDKTLLPDSEQ